MRRRREDIQRELRNLVDTAARCGYSATVVEAISDRERELSEITRRLFAAEPESVSSEVARHSPIRLGASRQSSQTARRGR